MSTWKSCVAVLLCSLIAPLHAQPPTAPAPASTVAVTDLATVTVSGVQPGPGLWKVSRGEHVLWLLGVIPSLPEHMQWQSDEVAQVIAQAQEVILPPKVKLKVDVGFFGKLFLLPSAYGARKNADGRTLAEVLPAVLYARWQALKQTYLARNHAIERWRPIFAAMELRQKALRQHGLRSSSAIRATVEALATQHGVKQTATEYQLVIEHPRAAIKAFKASAPDDVTCFARTLESIEHDLPTMTARANAWAIGDVATLRQLPDSHYRDACMAALTEAGFAHQLGLNDVPARVEAIWQQAARRALATNRQSVALLPMDELLAPDGYLAHLQAQGYTVEAPDDDERADAASVPATAGSTAGP